ncbi:MAG: sigma-70 family RNA polymerase sigma factor [Planctomycetota bacterium]
MDSTSVSLLRRLGQHNSEEAWERFASLYSPMIYRWGVQNGLGAESSADLLQEVLAKLLVKMREFSYQPGLRFRSWLKTVVVNHARDLHRKQNRRAAVSLSENEEFSGSTVEADVFAEREYREFLVARARDLMRSEFESKTWDACWLYVAEGLSSREVSERLGMSENAVRVAKCRVLARLRKELEGLLD